MREPRRLYAALLHAPALAAWKVGAQLQKPAGGGAAVWVARAGTPKVMFRA